jgi:uncharacterized protein YjdB
VVTIIVNPLSDGNLITVTPINDTICYGAVATVNASASAVNSPVFKWYVSQTEPIAFYTGPSYTTSNLIADTTFYISVSGTNYCENATNARKEVKVAVRGKLEQTAAVDDQDICYNKQPLSITGGTPSGGNGDYTYQWQDSTNGTWNNIATSGTSADYLPPILTQTTKYRRILTSGGSCGSDTSNVVTITVNPLPQVSINSGADSIFVCQTHTTPLTGSPSSGGTGTWRSTDEAVATVDASGLVMGLTAGWATIWYIFTTDVTLCTDSAFIVATVGALPQITINGDTVVCATHTTQLTSNLGGGTWKSLNESRATVDANSGMVTGVSAGSVTIRYIVGNGNCTDSAEVTVIVNPLPVVQIAGTDSVCVSHTIQLSVTGNVSTLGRWKSLDTAIAKVDSLTGVVRGISDGSVIIRYTETNANGCIDSTDKTIKVNPLPMPIITGTDSVCVTHTIQLAVDVSGGTWKSLDEAIATVNSSGAVTGISNGNVFIRYTVTNASGCTDSTELPVKVNALPVVQITVPQGNDSSVCVTQTLQLTATGNVSASGRWKSLDITKATVDPISGLVTGVSAGNVIIRYTETNASGCIDSTELPVTVKPLPEVAIVGLKSICVGNTTQLIPVTGGTWVSSDPTIATVTDAGVVTAIAAGKVVFTFTSTATGCSATTDTLPIGTFPVVDPITGKNILCINEYTPLSCATPGGVWSLSNTNVDRISPETDNPAIFQAKAEGKTYVTYTVGTGTCQTKVTHLIKIIPTTPPEIRIGIER